MLTQLFTLVSVISIACASPAPAHGNSTLTNAPAWFNPYKKYPAPAGAPTSWNFTGQGAHYNQTHAAAVRAVEIIGGMEKRGPYGPGSVVTNGAALAWYNGNLNSGTSGVSPSNSYTCFSGLLGNYPAASQWMNFYSMFNLNQRNAMAWTGNPPDTSEQQGEIYNAIISISQQSLVDARLILAVIIQESGGWVRVPCTQGYNCGLMQANRGSVSYNPGNSNQQSQASVNQMVIDGTEGTTQGPGYVQYLNGGSDYAYTHCADANPYSAARAYNSGSCSTGGNMNCARYGTASYSNDIANRLIGWDGTGLPQNKCGFPAVGCV